TMASLVVCQSGLGRFIGPNDRHPPREKQIDALLGKAYSSIVARLEAQRSLLDRIVDILEEEQELSGTELRQLLAMNGGTKRRTSSGGQPSRSMSEALVARV